MLVASEVYVPRLSFFFGGLHDSRVLGIEEQENHLTIRLNDFSSHCICDAFAELKGLPSTCEEHIMPVSLRFESIALCSLSMITHESELLPIGRHRDYLRRLRTFLYDEFRDIGPEHIAVGLVFFTDTEHCLLEIEAQGLTLQEDQRSAFAEIFGPEHVSVFDAYWNERQDGKFFGDQSVASEFLKTRI